MNCLAPIKVIHEPKQISWARNWYYEQMISYALNYKFSLMLPLPSKLKFKEDKETQEVEQLWARGPWWRLVMGILLCISSSMCRFCCQATLSASPYPATGQSQKRWRWLPSMASSGWIRIPASVTLSTWLNYMGHAVSPILSFHVFWHSNKIF